METNRPLSRSLFFEVFGPHGSRVRRDRRDLPAIGICRGGTVVSYNYKCLHRDTAALATLALRSKVSSMLLYGGDLREVTILILTASLLGIPLTVCDEKVTPNGELTDALSSPCLVIAPPSVTTDLPTKHIGIEHAQFIAAIEGEDDSFPAFIPLSDRFSITFITKNGRECYGSSSIAFSARGFSASCRLIRGERTLTELSPLTPVGAICGLLSCLISGGCCISLDSHKEMTDYCDIVRPHRLLCSREGALEAERILNSGGSVTLPIPFRSVRAERRHIAKLRRMAMGKLMRLGGELRQITLVGGVSPSLLSSFTSAGILSASLLSCPGCPSVAMRSYLTDKTWIPLNGMIADICSVEAGGRGIITLSGRGICTPPNTPEPHGQIPGSFRIDEWNGLSLVTDLYGFITPKGNILVEKRLSHGVFLKKMKNNFESVL